MNASLFTTPEPGLSITWKPTLLFAKHYGIFSLHLNEVCVCLFSRLEYASGLETSLNVSGVSISFT